MKYKKFIIENYRAISGPLEIDIDKDSLIPIIGVNECGKTTILQAIFTFDYLNDSLNKGRHLKDASNLYRIKPADPTIGAEIEITWVEFRRRLNILRRHNKGIASQLEDYIKGIKNEKFHRSITVTRNLRTKRYHIAGEMFKYKNLNNVIAKEILKQLPYILYFDDFRDSVDEEIEIEGKEKGSGWLQIIERLFNETHPDLSVFGLPDLEQRQRKSVISKVERKLNKTLTREWQNFRLDDSDLLRISIDYEEKLGEGGKRSFIKLEVVEKDQNGDEHFFFISDRSKGFFWFFNFVMKLEFNPKVAGTSDYDAIYLLDEPGSYLHASAQSKLCKKLRDLSEKNKVIYCTHSHYLLNPEVIPINKIKISEKSGSGDVTLTSIDDYKGDMQNRVYAFQPLIDALKIKPFLLDFTHEKVIIAEGIYDFYALELFRDGRSVRVTPSFGADSVRYFISFMIAWRTDYFALWDNDKEGRKSKEVAEKFFGPRESEKRFHLLPINREGARKRILQDLFAGSDIRMIKERLGLGTNSSFKKIISSLFYSRERDNIISMVSAETKDNFAEVFKELGL